MYVRKSIEALVQEGVLGAVLCSLVILIFLGEWRMTGIAIMTLPISVLALLRGPLLHRTDDQRHDLAGMTLAIGPMIDSAIICLENTHRHLGMGVTPHEAAFLGTSEVAMPELVSTLCTFLVLSPLVFTPGLGQFLFKPMAMAVAFSMIAAYHPVADARPGLQRLLAQAARGPRATGEHGARARSPRRMAVGARPCEDSETFQINGNGNAMPPAGSSGGPSPAGSG